MTEGMGTPYGMHGVQEYYPEINMDTRIYYSPQPQTYYSNPPTQQMNSPPQEYNSYPPAQMVSQYDYIKPPMPQEAPPSNQNTVDDDFLKAQEILLPEPMEQGDGQMEYPAGPLLSLEQHKPQQFISYNAGNNNNNNNNNCYIQPNTNQQEWGQPLDPVDLRTPAVDHAKEEIFREIDTYVKIEQEREKAKGYSATCLAKKRALLESNSKTAQDLKDYAKTLEKENQRIEENIDFAVEHILNRDNNSNDYFSEIEIQKEAIIQQSENEKEQDEKYQEKVKTLRKTENELAKAEFDQKNKDTIPVYVEDPKKGRRIASNTTLATRISRKKRQLETCKFDYDAVVLKYKIERLQRIKQLLDNYVTNFRPYLTPILQNPPEALWQQLNWQGKTEDFYSLQQLILKPG